MQRGLARLAHGREAPDFVKLLCENEHHPVASVDLSGLCCVTVSAVPAVAVITAPKTMKNAISENTRRLAIDLFITPFLYDALLLRTMAAPSKSSRS
jgi:hypothetical protein